MVGMKSHRVIGQIQSLLDRGALGHLGDAQLLDVLGCDCDAEAAFETLVARHGPSVLRTCRRFLKDHGDVDDAFQATFLVLARRAGSLRSAESVGPWLEGVARRVSLKARVAASRRRFHEQQVEAPVSVEGDPRHEVSSVVRDEVDRLPERLRAAVLLCYFEQMTYGAAAQRIGVTEATIRGRLATAREQLRVRLSQNEKIGLARSRKSPPAIGLGCVDLSSSVMRLAEGALRMMFVARLIRVGLAIAGLGVAGAAFVALHSSGSGAVGANAFQREKIGRGAPKKEASHDILIQGTVVRNDPKGEEIVVEGPGKLMLWVDRSFLAVTDFEQAQDTDRSKPNSAGAANPPPKTGDSSINYAKSAPRDDPKLLTISWSGNMRFTGKTTDPDGQRSSRAEFHGRVAAEVEGASLTCQEKMFFWTEQVVPFERIQLVSGETGSEKLVRRPETKVAVVHGYNKIVFAHRSVTPGKQVLFDRQRIEADDFLAYDSRTGNFRIDGKGRVQFNEQPSTGATSKAGQDPAPSAGLISFNGGMSARLGVGTETDAIKSKSVHFWGGVNIISGPIEQPSVTTRSAAIWFDWPIKPDALGRVPVGPRINIIAKTQQP